MRPHWIERGGCKELWCGDVLWATVRREAPYYRVRLMGRPGSRLRRVGGIRPAMNLAEQWYKENC